MKTSSTAAMSQTHSETAKSAGRQTFAAAKMGEGVILGLLESIRKATAERREYGRGKKAAFASGVKARGNISK